VDCKVEDAIVDERLKLASTPAYMLGPWIAPVATGIDKLVAAVLEMS
jgi:enhancing lycopene biosynthesis protein 2